MSDQMTHICESMGVKHHHAVLIELPYAATPKGSFTLPLAALAGQYQELARPLEELLPAFRL